MSDLSPFPCTACGLCCRRVHMSDVTAYLDRGDGICRHLDIKTNLCDIYDTRPLVCRVEAYYKTYLADTSWDGFVRLNLDICQKLQAQK
ncbi:YkgJ family cysteine cluster protein [Moraxella nonliquefaciens]|uniref:Flagellin N-methylase n=1 Tax=Moraxella nonliquefaciens TaxID=478 RepID=A0A1B8PIU8_MORNO|nr:YkgJ family cysteine cluster protein [Moraxella nonliquefaciens]OBX50248.1 flagellin N-methylase [Moraxella nonliquefaciens]